MILVGKAVVRNNTAGYYTPDADENVVEASAEMPDQDTEPEQTVVLSQQVGVAAVAVVVVEAAVVASARFSASCHYHQNPRCPFLSATPVQLCVQDHSA